MITPDQHVAAMVASAARDRLFAVRRLLEERRSVGAPTVFPILAEVATNDGNNPGR